MDFPTVKNERPNYEFCGKSEGCDVVIGDYGRHIELYGGRLNSRAKNPGSREPQPVFTFCQELLDFQIKYSNSEENQQVEYD